MTPHPVAQNHTTELLISSDQRLPISPVAPQSGRRTALVKAVNTVCSGVVSIELCPAAEGEPFPAFEAGAHIDLHLQGGMVRSYSLHNAPGESNRYVIGVLNDSASRGGSRWIHEHLRAGDHIPISSPRNLFALNEQQPAHSVFVAGGIGVTPILSMLRRLVQLGRGAHVILCARSRGGAPFLDELTQLTNQGITLHTHFDDEAGGPPSLRSLLMEHQQHDHFYCCGPSPMLTNFESTCAELGFANVHVERFKADQPASPKMALTGSCIVELRKSGVTMEIPKNKPALQAFLDAGVDIEFSCEEGVCGACETRILEGEAEHRDSVLSGAQKAAQKSMMVCVSRCRSDRMVLDL
ncbi:PDR/VanB family oxidoreductase [Ottowia thiooxydans]|uniref:PDR/VanB family oxidoreductase n=1 Tax=Ottowia thiooxydans TaxID=219182 RepID=UPI0004131870|nr:PDR/VanB family oxidoreductase [Ottowia thiooxydans]